jgi:hypothetical protein
MVQIKVDNELKPFSTFETEPSKGLKPFEGYKKNA